MNRQMRYLFFMMAAVVVVLTSCNTEPRPDSGTDEPVTDSTVEESIDNTPAESHSDTAVILQKSDTVKKKSETIETKQLIHNEGEALVSTDIQGQAIVYKTRDDYSRFVPVTLSDDKTKIIAYPSPQDIYYKGKLAMPTPLIQGYWLDNRGINRHTAFLSLTYEEYSKLVNVPGLNDLFKLVFDTNPITEIYNLGTRSEFKNEVEDINKIIRKGELKKYKKVK